MRVHYELEANELYGDNITLATGTKTQCKNAFKKLSEKEKEKYYFISLQPYSSDYSERLDFDEVLYQNTKLLDEKR